MERTSGSIKLEVLEERVNNMCKQNNADHTEILKKIEEIREKLDTQFVTVARFAPVEKIAYGLVTTLLVGVIGALLKLVIAMP